MGYPHITDLNLSHHSFHNAKPLIPKPNPACPSNTASHATGGSKAELSEHSLGSSRWNPTPEQLLALEELYRRGTRTPSAAQIQQIATRLRRFGKIEGKNVFYWFQNHKARERQKRRRQLEAEHEPKQCDTAESFEKKEPGSLNKGCEIEQTKINKGPHSSFSKLSEELSLRHGVAAEKESQQRKSTTTAGRVSTWQAMELPCSPIYLINSKNTATSLAPARALKPRQENVTNLEDENREEQTLELFPLGSNNDRKGINISKKDKTQVPITALNTTFSTTPNHYFEFLPLKEL